MTMPRENRAIYKTQFAREAAKSRGRTTEDTAWTFGLLVICNGLLQPPFFESGADFAG
jgi:hypothetical protein